MFKKSTKIVIILVSFIVTFANIGFAGGKNTSSSKVSRDAGKKSSKDTSALKDNKRVKSLTDVLGLKSSSSKKSTKGKK